MTSAICSPFSEPGRIRPLIALTRAACDGLEVLAPAQAFGQAFHIFGSARLIIMGVLVILTVAELLHQRSRRVAQVERHGLSLRLKRVLLRGEVRLYNRVRLGG